MDTYIAYIRVSATHGRVEGGEGALEQREAVAAWEDANPEVEIIEWAEDFDQSGGKASRPALNRTIKRIEAGEADGIVVAKLNRLSRLKRFAALELIDKIDAAGGKFAALDFGLDPTTPTGEMLLSVMLSIARMEHRTLTEGLDNSKRRRRGEGVHLAPAPFGYVRPGKNAKLVPDPVAAALVLDCFKLRADGASWMELVRHLEAGGHRMSKSAVGYMLGNKTYLGAIAGGEEGEVHHEPIVTPEQFDAAQGKGRAFAKDGTLAAEGLLSGLLTCPSCHGRMAVARTGSRQPDGKRGASYRCKGHSSENGRCPAPSSVMMRAVDDYVAESISLAIVDGTLRATMDAVERYGKADEAVQRAQRELDGHRANAARLIRALGADGYADTAEQLAEQLADAKRQRRDTPRPEDSIEADSELWTGEHWTIDMQRRLAKQFIAEVTVSRSGNGRWGPPMHERVRIRWAGQSEFDDDLPRRVLAAREQHAGVLAKL